MNNLQFPGSVPLLGQQPVVVIQAQLTDDERQRLREMVREMIREELAAVLHKPEQQESYICELCGFEKGIE